MRFYHDSKPNWLTNVLSRAQHWKILSNNHFAKWVDGCVLCGRTTAQSRLSPRLCAFCTEQLPHHLSNNLSDTNEFHRCAQCAHLLSTPEPYCLECLTEPPAFTHTIAFADYAEQMQHMLLQYKFHNALHLAPVLADALRHALSHYAQQHRPDVIVLVPQLDERTAERGLPPRQARREGAGARTARTRLRPRMGQEGLDRERSGLRSPARRSALPGADGQVELTPEDI